MNREYDLKRLRECCDNLMKLAELNAPAPVLAHCLIRTLMPKAMRLIGVQTCAAEFAAMQTYMMCLELGVCIQCKKTPADGNDFECARCRAEFDQWCAEHDFTDEPEGESTP